NVRGHCRFYGNDADKGLPKTTSPNDATRCSKSTTIGLRYTAGVYLSKCSQDWKYYQHRFAVSHAVLDRDHVRETQPNNPNLQKYEDRISEIRNQLDEQVADLGIPLAKMPTTHDDLKALCEKYTTQQSPKARIKAKKAKKADTDSDGFKLPPKHLTRKHPRGAATPVSTTPISIPTINKTKSYRLG
ncbi:hypothetical protein CEXT_354691, partial [Caerostris extrusa]